MLGWEYNIPLEEFVKEIVKQDLNMVKEEETDTGAPRPRIDLIYYVVSCRCFELNDPSIT